MVFSLYATIKMMHGPINIRCHWVFTSSHIFHRPLPSSPFFTVLIHVMLQTLHSHTSDSTLSTIQTPQLQVRNNYVFLWKRGTENKFTQTRHKFSIRLTKKRTKYCNIYFHLKNSDMFFFLTQVSRLESSSFA